MTAERAMWGGMWAQRLREGGMRQKAMEIGLVTSEEETEAMALAWEDWVKAEDGCFGNMNGEILITRV